MQPQTPQQKAQTMQQAAEKFHRMLAQMHSQATRPFNPNPIVQGRPVNLYQLWMLVVNFKGSKMVTTQNLWPVVAQNMGFAQEAAHDIKKVYEVDLALYEQRHWANVEAKRRQHMAGMAGMGGAAGMAAAQQMSPTRPMMAVGQDMQAQQQQYMQQLQQRVQPPQTPQQSGQMTPQQGHTPLPATNGFSSPQPDAVQARQASHGGHTRSSLSRHLESATPTSQTGFTAPSPVPPNSASAVQPPTPVPETNGTTVAAPPVQEDDTEYKPSIRTVKGTYGGIDVDGLYQLGGEILAQKPDVPPVDFMGVIDFRAITLSLESGIFSEVRYALDTLLVLSTDRRIKIELEKCEDLLHILIEAAEEQVELLAEEAPEVSDAIGLSSYEDIVRATKLEAVGLQDVSEFGTIAYNLDRAADRLIAIVALLRNLATVDENLRLLTSPFVIKMFSHIIRLLGTRNLLLRSSLNTADFMKDALSFLCYVSHHVELPSREDTHNLLHFLLAFAPSPLPPSTTPLRFTLYNPNIHRYLPLAVDTLAKFLARDEPNRHFFKTVLSADAQSGASDSNPVPGVEAYGLLTRTFALAISIIPDRTRRDVEARRVAELRKPTLIHGMLAADILASLCPGPESGVARAWLESEDAWGASLLRLCSMLSNAPPGVRANMDHEETGFALVTRRALTMLKTLVEKSAKRRRYKNGIVARPKGATGFDANSIEENGEKEKTDDDANGEEKHETAVQHEDEEDRSWLALMADIIPATEIIVGALGTPTIDTVALKHLVALAGIEA